MSAHLWTFRREVGKLGPESEGGRPKVGRDRRLAEPTGWASIGAGVVCHGGALHDKVRSRPGRAPPKSPPSLAPLRSSTGGRSRGQEVDLGGSHLLRSRRSSIGLGRDSVPLARVVVKRPIRGSRGPQIGLLTKTRANGTESRANPRPERRLRTGFLSGPSSFRAAPRRPPDRPPRETAQSSCQMLQVSTFRIDPSIAPSSFPTTRSPSASEEAQKDQRV